MQVSVETTNSLERRMTVGLPKERVQQEIQDRLKSLTRTAKINGFRPGKVPMRVVEQKYGGQVRQEVIGELVQSSFQEAIRQEKLRPAGFPKIDFNGDLDNPEQDLSYTAAFEIYPEITAIQVDGLAVEKPVVNVSDADIDTMLQKLRQQRRTWQEFDNTSAEKGDRVIVDLVGTINGEPFDGDKVEKLPLVLGENLFDLPGLEDHLLGACANQDRELAIAFPEDHRNTAAAGKTAQFKIHVHSVAKPQLPEMDADFAKALGVEDGNIDTLRHDVRNNMERELKFAIKNKLRQEVFAALLKANTIDVPNALIEEEAQRLLANFQEELKKQGVPDFEGISTDMFTDRARNRIKLGILISELVKANKIEVHADRVRQLIEGIAAAYEEPETIIQWFYTDKKRLNEVESTVLEEQVVEWLLERAQVTEKQLDFYSVMEQKQNPQAEAIDYV